MDHEPPPTRRRVLGVTAGLGVAGALAACGGSSAEVPAAAGSTSDPAAASSAVESAGGGGGGGGGGGLIAVADVPVGGGVILAKPAVVVTQPVAGTFKAFSSTCTHQACTVAEVTDGLINCVCHGSSFSITDGAVKGGPAPAPLPPVAVMVEGDQVVEG